MRRLTSAEYAYTIQDLTGLDLDLTSTFISDAVGGEGFTNVGDVQFMQASILERYLESAKIVASHAVIGAGPLQFFSDPGRTGLELSAIHRVRAGRVALGPTEIFRGRVHGGNFRTARPGGSHQSASHTAEGLGMDNEQPLPDYMHLPRRSHL